MKYLVILSLALLAGVAADEEWKPTSDKDVLEKWKDDCVKEVGVTTEQVSKINRLNFPDEKEVREYVHCVGTKMGVFSDDKGYDLDRVMEQFSVFFHDITGVREEISDCLDSNEQKSTPAEWAYRVNQCILTTKFGEAMKKAKNSS